MLPHFKYMLTRLFFTKRSGSQVVWMSCSWTPLTSLTGYKLGHTLSTSTKLNLWGVLPFLLQLFENAPLGWCGIFVFWQWAKNLKFFQQKKEVLDLTRSSQHHRWVQFHAYESSNAWENNLFGLWHKLWRMAIRLSGYFEVYNQRYEQLSNFLLKIVSTRWMLKWMWIVPTSEWRLCKSYNLTIDMFGWWSPSLKSAHN